MTLEELRKKYPKWDIDPPHFVRAREGSAAGEVGNYAHWRQWATPNHAPSRYTITAFADADADESKCLEDMDRKLSFRNVAYEMEM